MYLDDTLTQDELDEASREMRHIRFYNSPYGETAEGIAQRYLAGEMTGDEFETRYAQAEARFRERNT